MFRTGRGNLAGSRVSSVIVRPLAAVLAFGLACSTDGAEPLAERARAVGVPHVPQVLPMLRGSLRVELHADGIRVDDRAQREQDASWRRTAEFMGAAVPDRAAQRSAPMWIDHHADGKVVPALVEWAGAHTRGRTPEGEDSILEILAPEDVPMKHVEAIRRSAIRHDLRVAFVATGLLGPGHFEIDKRQCGSVRSPAECIGIGIDWQRSPRFLAWRSVFTSTSCHSLSRGMRKHVIREEDLPVEIDDAVLRLHSLIAAVAEEGPLCRVPRLAYHPDSRYGEVVRLMATVQAHVITRYFDVDPSPRPDHLFYADARAHAPAPHRP
jgi:hypothetical protein